MQLLSLHQALFVEPSPAPTKWALERLGRCRAAVRLPITPLSAAGQAVEHGIKRDFCLQTRQGSAQAEMDARAE